MALGDLRDNAVNCVEEFPISKPLLENLKVDKVVVILRSPKNVFASRIKHWNLISPSGWIDGGTTTNQWTNYARLFNKVDGVIFISYDEFVQSEHYRRLICDKLGGVYSDKTLSRVEDVGRGSSFDGVMFDGKAQEMKVFERSEVYKDNPKFQALFTDEIKALSKEIFGV